jgi:hypothetical protein
VKAIQSFRSDNLRPALESIGGGAMIRGQLFSMALSACTIAQYYPEFEYITDDAGKEMATVCKFPFSKIISIGENFDSDASFWTHSKFEAYRTSEPFLHFDNDLFLWEALPEHAHKADIVALHGESFMWPLYEDYLLNAVKLPNWPMLHEIYFSNKTPINMAIFGGNDISTINAYANEVLDLILPYFKNDSITESDKNILANIMPVIEQLWGSQIIQCKWNKKITFLMAEKTIANSGQMGGLNLTHLGGKKGLLQKDPKKTYEMYAKILANIKRINPEVHNAVRKFTSDSEDLLKLMELK